MARGPLPLVAVIAPVRRQGLARPELAPVSASEALIHLTRNSFLARTLEDAPWAADRFDRLGRLVSSVPVYRLAVPEGHDRLREVAEAVEELAGRLVLERT